MPGGKLFRLDEEAGVKRLGVGPLDDGLGVHHHHVVELGQLVGAGADFQPLQQLAQDARVAAALLVCISTIQRMYSILSGELKPFADEVDKRFQAWIFRHNAQRGTAFSPEQTDWLRLMKEHIASSCSISRDDFDYAELADKGGLQKAWGLFGKDLDTLMNEMNMGLVA